ncbi:TfoX/Sxy family protein [Mucilaginibacter sp. KACC 22063]|uniref:TfoX/Sxy family protein n=1 Tax=Mucilaginibacter sp. KACC 22063 TaxID=3025666 RepID=UPI0023658F86|nr:TfoX/Sxy family protein [Mucilaginibacter sp. KACC 22063]WDF55647.1 TfoX/Sxy family protein [Mucilaginibacter sp. KACC 22063]
MAHNQQLINRVREYLANYPELHIIQKEMFKCLAFMVNNKLCVGVSGDEILVRFDAALHDEFAERTGFRPMQSKSRVYKGYGYIDAAVLNKNEDFDFWLQQCLAFNPRAKASKKK